MPYIKMLKVIESIIKKSNYNFDFIDLGCGMGIKYNTKTNVMKGLATLCIGGGEASAIIVEKYD